MVCVLRSEVTDEMLPWCGAIIVPAGCGPLADPAGLGALRTGPEEWLVIAEAGAAVPTDLGLPVVSAPAGGGIAGCLLGAMDAVAQRHRETAWLAVCPGDRVPSADYVALCLETAGGTGAEAVFAVAGGAFDPSLGLWRVEARHALRRAVTHDGAQGLWVWLRSARVAVVAVAGPRRGSP